MKHRDKSKEINDRNKNKREGDKRDTERLQKNINNQSKESWKNKVW